MAPDREVCPRSSGSTESLSPGHRAESWEHCLAMTPASPQFLSSRLPRCPWRSSVWLPQKLPPPSVHHLPSPTGESCLLNKTSSRRPGLWGEHLGGRAKVKKQGQRAETLGKNQEIKHPPFSNLEVWIINWSPNMRAFNGCCGQWPFGSCPSFFLPRSLLAAPRPEPNQPAGPAVSLV